MLEIAGGILIAVAILVALLLFWEFLVIGAVLGIGLAIVAVVWFLLASEIGPVWATAAIVGAGAGLWGFNALQDSEWNERRIRKAALRKARTPYSLSDSIGFALINISVVSILGWITFMAIDEVNIRHELTFIIILFAVFLFSSAWHYKRFVVNYENENEKYKNSNLVIMAFGKSFACGFISLVFIPMIMFVVIDGINGSLLDNGFVPSIIVISALVLCAVIARNAYCGVIQKGLPSAREN